MKLHSKFNYALGKDAADRDIVRTFRIDMNMLCEVEQILNERIMQNEKFWKDMSFIKLRAIAYAMLYAEDPRPSIKEVGSMLSEGDLGEFTNAFMAAFSKDFAESKGSKKASKTDPTQG